jgi:hypothetical protein
MADPVPTLANASFLSWFLRPCCLQIFIHSIRSVIHSTPLLRPLHSLRPCLRSAGSVLWFPLGTDTTFASRTPLHSVPCRPLPFSRTPTPLRCVSVLVHRTWRLCFSSRWARTPLFSCLIRTSLHFAPSSVPFVPSSASLRSFHTCRSRTYICCSAALHSTYIFADPIKKPRQNPPRTPP